MPQTRAATSLNRSRYFFFDRKVILPILGIIFLSSAFLLHGVEAAQKQEPTYFALIENGSVKNVIVADQAFVDSQPGKWVQTWMDGKSRHNYAGIGYKFNQTYDAFIPPKIFASWKLNTTSFLYDPPVPFPKNNTALWVWDEAKLNWGSASK